MLRQTNLRQTVMWFRILTIAIVVALSPLPAEAASKTVLVLIDLSKSTESHRADYEKYFQTILSAMKEGDVLLVARIAKAPAADSVLELRQEYPPFSVMENPTKQKRQIAKLRGSATESVKKMLAGKSAQTPILDTLREVERFFANYPRDKKVLVFMSDMLESSRQYDFEKTPLNEGQNKAILGDLKQRKLIPNLGGVVVYVAGARTRSMQQRNMVRSFWLQYFQEAGAKADPNRYGAELLAFKE